MASEIENCKTAKLETKRAVVMRHQTTNLSYGIGLLDQIDVDFRRSRRGQALAEPTVLAVVRFRRCSGAS